MPNRPKRFGAITCKAKREVWFDDEGRMRVCTVAKSVTLGRITIGSDAYTHFHPDGTPEQTDISSPHQLQTASGLSVTCGPGHVSLSAEQALEHCTLDRETTIAGVVLEKGQSVAFHPTGELWAGVLARSVETPLGTFPVGTRLRWRPDGSLLGGSIPEPQSIGGHAVRSEFEVHENGTLATFMLAEPETIAGRQFPDFATIRLRTNGSLWRAEFVSDSGFMVHGERWEDTTHQRFSCAGELVDESVEHWQADRPPPKFR